MKLEMVQFYVSWFQLCPNMEPKKLFLFDLKSCNSEGEGFGQSVLLAFHSVKTLNLFIMQYFEKYYDNTPVLQCDIQYVKVKISMANAHSILDTSKKQRNVVCVKNVQKKHASCKNNAGNFNSLHDNFPSKKRCKKQLVKNYARTNNSLYRIEILKKRPTFVYYLY